jgi:hypothetical protein
LRALRAPLVGDAPRSAPLSPLLDLDGEEEEEEDHAQR